MGNFAQLSTNGGVDLWVIVPVKIGPNRRVGIDVFPPAHVPKQSALSALDDQRLAEAVAQVHPDRARSFASRLYTEDVLVQNTWRSPLLGLGTWGDDRTIMVDGQEEYVVVDGLWILAFSRYGVIGLLAILSVYFFPAFRVLRRTRPQDWSTRPDHGP